jgi:plasmid stabilization system protein ParE
MARRIDRTKEARKDADSIWNYIAAENPTSADPEAADRVIRALHHTYDRLAEFPNMTEITGTGLYRSPVDGFNQYLILYRFDEKIVEILRVFRSDLDWKRVAKKL